MNGRTKEINPDKVAIYIRWSTEDQSDGTTLVVQQEGCQHYVMSQGWKVTPSLIFVDDGYSGGTLDRPKMDELRLAVKAGQIDCVVVYKIDRLSRSVMDTVNLVLAEWEGRTFLKSAREPIDTTTAMGKQFFYMLVSYAEWERAVIRERTYSGKLRRAKEGKNTGGPCPYGYRRTNAPGILEVDDQSASLIRRIFKLYLSEVGAYSITDTLNKEGIPSPNGGKWNQQTILKMLKNEFYAGRLVYGKLTYNPRHPRDKSEPWFFKNPDPIRAESQCPAIITPEEFERVQALLERRSPKVTGVRSLSSDYLLTGILRCECGAPMNSHTSDRHAKGGKTYSYYWCQNKKQRGMTSCTTGLIPQKDIDSEIEAKLKELLLGEEAYQRFTALRWVSVEAQLAETEESLKRTTANLKGLDEHVKRINRDYRGGLLSAALYEENRRELDEEVAQGKDHIKQLERLAQSLAMQLRERDGMREVFDLAQRWDDITMAQRKFVLRNVISSIVASKTPRTDDLRVQVVWKFSDPGVKAAQ
jgi:site-specific DNA recombinase